MPDLDPALAVALAHEQRRRQPLPPLSTLTGDDALRVVREAEWRRAGEKLNAIIEAARTP